MTINPEAYAVDLTAHEYETPCQARHHDEAAEWLLRIEHCVTHAPVEVFLCDECKEIVVAMWLEFLEVQDRCTCGYLVAGQLSDHLRAIRL